MKYDVIIIGAGPSGIFCAYELLKEKPEQAHSPTESFLFPRMSVEICRRF